MPKLFKIFLLIFLSMPMLSRAEKVGHLSLQTDSTDIKKSFLPLISYMERNLRFPMAALSNKTQGNVIVEFELTADGIITNTKFMNDEEVKKLGSDMGSETARILKKFKDKKKELRPGIYILPVTYMIMGMEEAPERVSPELLKQSNCLPDLLITAGGMMR